MKPSLQCDFCLAADPCWQYPAEDFRMPDGQMSHGGWAACSTCHDLIEAETFADLARRAAGRLKRHTGVYALEQIAANHAAFREHRTGPALPLDGTAYVSGLRPDEIEQRETVGRLSAAAAPTARIEFHVDGPAPRPAQYCTQFVAHYAGIWKKVEETRALRFHKTDPVRWPDWCFLPRWWSSRIVAGLCGRRDPDVSDDSSGAWLCALAAWRMTQGIYRIDPDIAAELLKTPLKSDLPAEILFRLPEWSVYIEAPEGLTEAGCAVAGFFAYLDGIGTEEVDLIVIADLRANPDAGIPEDYLNCHAPVALGAVSLAASIQASLELAVKIRVGEQVAPEALLRADLDSTVKEERNALAPYISLLLYLCSTAADIADHSGRRERPANPVPVKTKKGIRMFPADRVTQWDVGFRMGAESDTPRKAGGLMSWAASKAVGQWFRRRAMRASMQSSELSVIPIRDFLLADVLADLLQLESDRGHRVAACPKVLSGEVSLLARDSGDSDGTLPFEKPDHARHRVLRRYRDTHMNMIWHQVPFDDLALFLLGQRMEDRPKLLADRTENGLPPSLRDEHHMIFTVPLGMG